MGSYRLELRQFKEWLSSANLDEITENSCPAKSGIHCEKCGTYDGVIFYDLGPKFFFFCDTCLEKVKTEEVAPTISKGLSLRFQILSRDNFTCVYCGRNPKEDGVKLEVDHVFPKSKGGTDDPSNLVTACWECNQGKKDMVLPDIEPQK